MNKCHHLTANDRNTHAWKLWIGIRHDLVDDKLIRELVNNSHNIIKKRYAKKL